MSEETQTNYSKSTILKKFFQKYIKPRGKVFFPIQLLHMLGAVLTLIPPLILRKIIDQALPNQALGQLFTLVLWALGVYILKAVINGLKIFWGHKAAQKVTRDMRNDLYSHYQNLSLPFHDNKKTGELISRVIDDLNVLQEFIHHGPEGVIGSLTLMVGTVGILFSLNIQLTLVSLIFVPFLILFSCYLLSKMHTAFRQTRENKADMSDRLEDNLAGVKVIKAFAQEEFEESRFAEANEKHKEARINAIRYLSFLFPGSDLLNATGILAVLSYGGYLVVEGSLTVGTIVAFYGYLLQFKGPILRLVHVNERLSRFFASVERFFAHLEINPTIQNNTQNYTQKEIKGAVEFNNVSFSYEDGEQVLDGINLDVESNKTIALVGPSGAGKTSLVRLIPRLYEVDSGEVRVDGVDVQNWNLQSLRDSIAMVMQDDYLFSDSIAENIAYGRPDASREEIIDVAKQANAHEFINDLSAGYETTVGQRGVKLSGGQRQRVSIARAFLKDPSILILDEATSSVDLHTERLIQEAINRVTSGRTTFIIAHRLATIINADEILFLEDGIIKERGQHEELLAKEGKYFDFYNLQFENEATN
jgi:ATP-binding cassette subfamily B protein